MRLVLSTLLFYTLIMEATKNEKQWERTNVTKLLRNRQSGKYYARVKVNGQQKWRALKTEVFSVAKSTPRRRRKKHAVASSGSKK